jgi:DNA-binding XRE family transcriptional regulator
MTGPRKLSEYLKGRSRTDFAKAIGVGRVTVWRWETGARVPGVTDALAIARESGGAVPVTAWDEGATPKRRGHRTAAQPA